MFAGTLTGSTVINTSSASPALSVDTNFHAGTPSIVVRNSILFGGRGVGGRDVETAGPTVPTVNIDYSALRSGTAGVTGPHPATLGSHNVNATPLLASLTGVIDAHQLAGSPTIDAGDVASVGSSVTDLDGDARVIGAAPDIGADELIRPTIGPASVTTAVRSATVTGTINPNGRATTYHVEFETTTAYGASTADASAGSGTAAQPVTVSVTDLAPGTTHHARLVATSDQGASAGADITFVTGALPVVAGSA